MRQIALWMAGLLISAAILLLAVVEMFSATNEFSLKNDASGPIARASIEAARRSFDFKDIEPGAKITGSYRPADSVFVVHIEMSSGKTFEGSAGYITNGIALRHDIVVSDLGVEIIESALKSGR